MEKRIEMKKIATIFIVLAFILFASISCGKKSVIPEAGKAKAEDILSLIPKEAKGVFFVDIHKAMNLEVANKTIKEDENYQKLEEFIEKTGIDPKKDIFFAAIGIMGGTEPGKEKGVIIVNMKYDKDTLISLIKEKADEEEQNITEEEYMDFTLYCHECQKLNVKI